MSFDRQTTLRAAVTLTGIGVHSGAPASICLKPSSANSGVVFLRTGIEGISDNITVRSIVGRQLEHSRIFWFANGGEEQLYLSSADWMPPQDESNGAKKMGAQRRQA